MKVRCLDRECPNRVNQRSPVRILGRQDVEGQRDCEVRRGCGKAAIDDRLQIVAKNDRDDAAEFVDQVDA